MFKLISGMGVGFVMGAVYGVQFAVQVSDSKLIKMIRLVKIIWEAV